MRRYEYFQFLCKIFKMLLDKNFQKTIFFQQFKSSICVARKWYNGIRNFCQICLKVMLVFGENFKHLAPFFLDLWLIIKHVFHKNLIKTKFYRLYSIFLVVFTST